MHEFALGALAGALAGAASVALAGAWRARPTKSIDDKSSLSDADRTEVAAEFRTHTEAVRRQVTEYADALADGDPQLRRVLRQIEASQPWASS